MSDGYSPFAAAGASHDGYNATELHIRTILARCNTTTLVKVIAVYPGGTGAPGFVDFQPLVKQIDGAGNTYSHAPVYHCPYFRLQGGSSAIIIDPAVGDIGPASFTSRDISSVIATKAEAAPGSRRWFDMADGIYHGGVLNGAPDQWVKLDSAGIELHSPTLVKLDAPDVQIECETLEINASSSATINTPTFTVNGASTLNGAVIATSTVVAATSVTAPLVDGTVNVNFGGKSSLTHEHEISGVDTGTGTVTSGPPL